MKNVQCFIRLFRVNPRQRLWLYSHDTSLPQDRIKEEAPPLPE